MKPTVAVRLALAGTRTDSLRVALTATSAALATLFVLVAVTVMAIPTPGAPGGTGSGSDSTQYRIELLVEPGLRKGVAIALILLTIPVLALAGQCARLGAPARDRRLAAFRLAGATPRQTRGVVVTETGLASLSGAVVALVLYLVGRVMLNHPDVHGKLLLPTDVLPPVVALVAVVAGLPLVAASASALLLRRVVVTPFGVVRRTAPRRKPRPWPAVLIVAGLVLLTSTRTISAHAAASHAPVGLVLMIMPLGVLAAVLGVILGTAWIASAVGRVLYRYARGPAVLLAARRLQTDPWWGSRTFAALLAGTVVGGGAANLRAWFVAQHQLRFDAQRIWDLAHGQPLAVPSPEDDFYLRTMDLVDMAVSVALILAALGMVVAVAEGVVSRRRANAVLVATGVPPGVLARAVLWQTCAPVFPAILLALVVGALATTALAPPTITDGTLTRTVPFPLGELAWYGSGVAALVVATAAVGVAVLRSGTSIEDLRTG